MQPKGAGRKSIPKWWDRYRAILASKLNSSQKLAMLVIAGFAGERNRCTATMQKIADGMSLSERAAVRIVRELHDAGLIERVRQRHAASVLSVNWSRLFVGPQSPPVAIDKSVNRQSQSPPVSNDKFVNRQIRQSQSPPVAIDTTYLNTKKNTKRYSAPTKQFVPPTLDEVTAYCRERGNAIDPAAFIDHYTANGWNCGRSKMRDWRAAVRTWERNQSKFSAATQSARPSSRSSDSPARYRTGGSSYAQPTDL